MYDFLIVYKQKWLPITIIGLVIEDVEKGNSGFDKMPRQAFKL